MKTSVGKKKYLKNGEENNLYWNPISFTCTWKNYLLCHMLSFFICWDRFNIVSLAGLLWRSQRQRHKVLIVVSGRWSTVRVSCNHPAPGSSSPEHCGGCPWGFRCQWAHRLVGRQHRTVSCSPTQPKLEGSGKVGVVWRCFIKLVWLSPERNPLLLKKYLPLYRNSMLIK